VRTGAYADTSGGPDACWPWIGAHDQDGYGKMSNSQRAHRVAWAYINGEIPTGGVIMHTCDNPPCCNPAHLVLGTNVLNIQDRDLKNRTARGESSPLARLTTKQVLQIRDLHKAGVSKHQLSRTFGVCRPTITSIINRETWKHV
jgi:hypothetical protein